MLHNEVNSRTPFAAGKAFTDILCWRHIERGGLVAMERTQPYIVYASFPKGNEFGNNVHNVCSIQYPVYGGLVYHCECEDTKKTSPRVNPAMFLTEYCNQNYLI